MRARMVVFVSGLIVCLVSIVALGDRSAARAASCPLDRSSLIAPVRGSLVASFSVQRCARCRTTRGIKVEVGNTTVIAATAVGEVTFAGQVAGTWWVVQRLDAPTAAGDEVLVTYGGFEPEALNVDAGDLVSAGAPLGRGSGRVHLGMRISGRYVDPFPCWGGRRPRLLPRAHVALAEPSR